MSQHAVWLAERQLPRGSTCKVNDKCKGMASLGREGKVIRPPLVLNTAATTLVKLCNFVIQVRPSLG